MKISSGVVALGLFFLSTTDSRATSSYCNDAFSRDLKSIFTSKNEAAPNAPRSKWGNSSQLEVSQKPYKNFSFTHRKNPIFPIIQGSLREKNEELVKILDDINYYQKNIQNFISDYRAMNFGSEPRLEDVRDFYYSRHEIYKGGMSSFIDELGKVDRQKALQVRILTMDRRPDQSINHGKELIDKMLRAKDLYQASSISNEYNAWLAGNLAEFHAFVSLPNVKAVSVRIENMDEIGAILKKKLNAIRLELADAPENLKKYERDYPKLFVDIFNYYRPATNKERMDFISNWIGSKEIDIIRESKTKTKWLELKLNRDVFTEAAFKEKHGKKSYFDQIKEDREILDFLGLQDKIDLEYHAIGGLSPEVKNLLREMNVQILEDKIKP